MCKGAAALTQHAPPSPAITKFGVGAGEDPFAKVKGVIRDLITV